MTGQQPASAAERAQALFADLAAEVLGKPGVDTGTMLRSEGLKVDGRFFAFVSRDADLVVKIPAEQAASLTATGTALPFRSGGRTLREWVSVPLPDTDVDADVAAEEGDGQGRGGGDGEQLWRGLVADAYAFVAALPAKPKPKRTG
ncbi:hypothetical protein [Yinghuangia soli]|uniref:TfoX N-terminal domain-containing protein n=1 Tax=Yinghuangia soli TaxID=2908204 RepID=A0AA41PXU1_9ACTN|nr:hypothetical protein [Yinghuangia soli]MCF2527345.1 hypothetical protein [Yinghuangia soli]